MICLYIFCLLTEEDLNQRRIISMVFPSTVRLWTLVKHINFFQILFMFYVIRIF